MMQLYAKYCLHIRASATHRNYVLAELEIYKNDQENYRKQIAYELLRINSYRSNNNNKKKEEKKDYTQGMIMIPYPVEKSSL